MENDAFPKRRQFIALVVATIIIFIAVVGLIATRLPWSGLGLGKSTSTLASQLGSNCTYPLTYWEAHPELYPTQVIIGGVAYKERELEALLSDDSLELAQQIKTQLAVAFLNSLAGADQSSIEATMFEAYGWLTRHPAGEPVTENDLASGSQLVNALQAFNLGLSGVEPCEAISGVALTGTAANLMEVGSQSPSQSASVTQTASITPTATSQVKTMIPPSRTPIPTIQAPRSISPTSTKYSPPADTDTPVPPAPTPTWTPVPDTPTYTPPPPPTSTFTPPPPPASTNAPAPHS